ncbi:hypothetical protein, conserved, partial [Eimeria acervulina]
RQLAALPLPPQLGLILLSSVSFNCVEEALTLVSMLSAEATLTTPFCISRGKAAALKKARKTIIDSSSDHLTLIKAYQLWTQAADPHAFCREVGLSNSSMLLARRIRGQLEDALKALGVSTPQHPTPAAAAAAAATAAATAAVEEGLSSSQQQALNFKRNLTKSCWQQAAYYQPETRQYITAVNRQTAKIHPTSVLADAPQPP